MLHDIDTIVYDHPLTQQEIDLVLLKCLGVDAKDGPSGFYDPSHLIMHITERLSPVAWEAVRIQESAHSIMCDSWLGWTIEALEDLSNNLFVAMKNEVSDQQELTSWIMNVEYKRTKLCQTWLQTQEGATLYFLIDLLNLEERSVEVANSLRKIHRKNLTKEDEDRVRHEAKQMRETIVKEIKSKDCRDCYWKGYEKVVHISKKFGQEFVAPSLHAACSVKIPSGFIEKTPREFDVMLENLKYNVDKRLDEITRIPPDKVSEKDKKDQLSFLSFLLGYLGEDIEKETQLYDYIGQIFSHQCLPKAFKDKFLPAFLSQKEKAEIRWKHLKEKGYDPSQIISLINTAGKSIAISDLEPVSTLETTEILEISYDELFVSLEKCSFIFECISEMDKRKKIEEWMHNIVGCREMERIRNLLSESFLLSKAKICPICSTNVNYKNYLLECPCSAIICCTRCCEALSCPKKCEALEEIEEKIARVTKMIKEFEYRL